MCEGLDIHPAVIGISLDNLITDSVNRWMLSTLASLVMRKKIKQYTELWNKLVF